jgi:hypothetical protein
MTRLEIKNINVAVEAQKLISISISLEGSVG